jgi:hypothetical protein
LAGLAINVVPAAVSALPEIPPRHVYRREADEDGGLGAEYAAAQNPRAGGSGQPETLGVGEAALGADQQDNPPRRLGRGRRRVAAVVEEQAQVGRREQG